jgi:SPOR domain
VAMIAPRIRGIYPGTPGATGVQYAMNTTPVPLPRPQPPVSRPPPVIRVAQLPEAPRPVIQPPPQHRVAPPPPLPRPPGGFHLITPALASTLPPSPPGPLTGSLRGNWAIQVGAFDHIDDAHYAIKAALRAAPGPLRASWQMVGSVREQHGMLYRARLVGLSRDAAIEACEQLGHVHTACFVISPAAQS